MEDLQNQNQQNNFNQTPQQNPKKGIPTFIGIAIILIVAIILFGGVFAYQYFTKSQTPTTNVQPNTQTADWKTCNNTNYGYEVKYPINWKVWMTDTVKNKLYQDCTQGLDNVVFSPIDVSKWDAGDETLSININSKEAINNGTSSEVFMGMPTINSLDDMINYDKTITQPRCADEIVTIGGERAINNCGEVYHLWHNNFLFQIAQTKVDPETLSKFLNSFKFTTPTVQTADWKTYTDSQYGFEIKYPEIARLSVDNVGPKPDHVIIHIVKDEKNTYTVAVLESGNDSYPLPKMPWVRKQENKDINGIEWIKTLYGQPGGPNAAGIVYSSFSVIKNGQLFEFIADSSNPNVMDSDVEVFLEQIVSTFKFTK